MVIRVCPVETRITLLNTGRSTIGTEHKLTSVLRITEGRQSVGEAKISSNDVHVTSGHVTSRGRIINGVSWPWEAPLRILNTLSNVVRGGSRLVDRGSQSVVVICHSTYEPGGGGRHMCCSTYIRVTINRLLTLQSLH